MGCPNNKGRIIMNLKPKSWKTTTGGVAAIIIAISGAVQLLTDGDALTNPDWNSVVAAVVAGVALIAARDNNVTSEKAGAK